MALTAPECIICAWRATCNLKFRYEGSSSLHCPEFTRDLSTDNKRGLPKTPLYEDTPSIKKDESENN